MDYHLESGRNIEMNGDRNSISILKNDGLIAQIEVELIISDQSRVNMMLMLKADSPLLYVTLHIDWNENHKFLKVDFSSNIDSMEAYYDCQFGHIRRPTHRNTTWDAAKFVV